MAIRTLWNRIWVKPQAKEQKTTSGLIMPTANDDKICYGVVEDSPIDEIKKRRYHYLPKRQRNRRFVRGRIVCHLTKRGYFSDC